MRLHPPTTASACGHPTTRRSPFILTVVNTDVQPNRIVTVFFDRRLGKKK